MQDKRFDSVVAPRAEAIEPVGLIRTLAGFRGADNRHGLRELAITAVPFVILWIATVLLVRAEIWLGLFLTIPAGAFLLRLFLIQHDCGHGSFFRQRNANRWVGRIIGVLTLTPFEFWRRSHAWHHAGTGNLDRRGLGDIDTLTLTEYRSRTRRGQWAYRVYRHPLVLFGLGPAYQFLLGNRMPAGLARGCRRSWISAMGTNLAIVLAAGALIWQLGVATFLIVHLPITLIAATIGMWLFYVQHQFENAQWDRDEAWNFHHAALHGSSHYDLPPVLRWFTANIGVHHVHHLCSTIPYYRMPDVLRSYPELKAAGRLGLRESFRLPSLALWNEETRRMISFAEAKAG